MSLGQRYGRGGDERSRARSSRRTERNAHPVRPPEDRRSRASQPHCHGAADAQPIDRSGAGSERLDARILRAARFRRPHHFRGDLGRARPASAIRIRPASGPASRSRAGAMSSRACMAPAGASSSSSGMSGASPIRSIMTARFPSRPSAIAPKGNVSLLAPAAPYVAPRAPEDRGNSGRRRGLSPRRRERQSGRLRRRRDPRRERLPARPVPAGQRQQARRRATAARSRTAPGSCSK